VVALQLVEFEFLKSRVELRKHLLADCLGEELLLFRLEVRVDELLFEHIVAARVFMLGVLPVPGEELKAVVSHGRLDIGEENDSEVSVLQNVLTQAGAVFFDEVYVCLEGR